METAFLKPVSGRLVRDPQARDRQSPHLPETGAERPLDAYWRRRLADGDVVKAVPAAPARKNKE